MVKDAPYPHEIAPLVRDIFYSADEILGYNVIFDNRVVTNCLGIDMNGLISVDPLKGFRAVKTESGHHKLGDAVEYYCPEELEEYRAGAHDAATDIKATLAVYRAYREKQDKIIDSILDNFREEMLKCHNGQELRSLAEDFKRKNPVSLQDEDIRAKVRMVMREVREKRLNVEREETEEEAER